MQVYEFNGKKYKASECKGSDVKVGDVVKIHEYIETANHWCSASKAKLGTFQVVSRLASCNCVCFVNAGGNWSNDYFNIMEEISDKVPRNHPHADMIRQWLDDASLEVEYRTNSSEPWFPAWTPMWETAWQYRFKPKTVPAWRALYEYHGDFDMTAVHYKTEEEFYNRLDSGEKFIRFILETEKQVQA